MLIHLPITIAFDAHGQWPREEHNAVATFVMTVRFDPADTSVPIEVCNGFPPALDAQWAPADAILYPINRAAYQRLLRRIARSPIDYCADIAEGERLQAALNDTLDCGRLA